MVAHRPSTVQLADRVAMLVDGKIAAIGTHSELLATNEEYRRLLSTMDEDRDEEVAMSTRRRKRKSGAESPPRTTRN